MRPPRSSDTSDLHLVPSNLATPDKDYLLILSDNRKIIHRLKIYIQTTDILHKCACALGIKVEVSGTVKRSVVCNSN